ncbi:MAG: periplasmic protein TonB [Synergistaceae bacterium]|nr:periplasmic protein TonB [Synergistaceae bacterium]MDI3532139.1 periplasmic protein TonB [Synergistaceae bacterium]
MKRWTFPIVVSLLFHALILSWAALCFYLPKEPKQRQIAVKLVRMPALTAHAEAGKIEEYPGPAPAFEESKTGQAFKAEGNEKEISNNNAKKDTTTKAKNTSKTLGKNQKEVKKLEDTEKPKALEPKDTKPAPQLKREPRIDSAQEGTASSEKAIAQQGGANDVPSSAPSPTNNNSPTLQGGARLYAQSDVVKQVKPIYPLASRRRGEEGTVLLEVRVDPSGTVEEVRIVEGSGYPLLDQAAERALKEWRFREGSGVIFLVPVQFKLQ